MEFIGNIQSLSLYLPELMIVLSILCVFIMESIPQYRHLTFLSTCIGLIFSAISLAVSDVICQYSLESSKIGFRGE